MKQKKYFYFLEKNDWDLRENGAGAAAGAVGLQDFSVRERDPDGDDSLRGADTQGSCKRPQPHARGGADR